MSDGYAFLSDDVIASALTRYREARSRINSAAAWAATFPPLGWFGRADRIEQDHARVSRRIHMLIRLQVERRTSSAKPVSPPIRDGLK